MSRISAFSILASAALFGAGVCDALAANDFKLLTSSNFTATNNLEGWKIRVDSPTGNRAEARWSERGAEAGGSITYADPNGGHFYWLAPGATGGGVLMLGSPP